MFLLASGRDCDVFDLQDGTVLRRYRDGRSADAEAEVLRAVGARGYPVPAVRSSAGPDLVMDRVLGVTLAESVVSGAVTPSAAGFCLARLHERLHSLSWPGALALLHMDLHPENVILGPRGPVVIDWVNARRGVPALDMAMTAVILAQAAVGIRHLRRPLEGMLDAFAQQCAGRYAGHLSAAQSLRAADANQSPEELEDLAEAVMLARRAAAEFTRPSTQHH